ncbi:MAG: hypothetical protein R3C70_01145 [Geminicoccaceae bacterium]
MTDAMLPTVEFCQRLLVRVGRWGSMRLLAGCWALAVERDPRGVLAGMSEPDRRMTMRMPHIQPLVELFRKTCRGDSKELAGLLLPLAHDWLEEIRERFRSDGHDGGTNALLWLERADERSKEGPLLSLLRTVLVHIGRPKRVVERQPAGPVESDEERDERLRRQEQERFQRSLSPEWRERLMRARGRRQLLQDLTHTLYDQLYSIGWHEIHEAERAKAEAGAGANVEANAEAANEAAPPPSQGENAPPESARPESAPPDSAPPKAQGPPPDG